MQNEGQLIWSLSDWFLNSINLKHFQSNENLVHLLFAPAEPIEQQKTYVQLIIDYIEEIASQELKAEKVNIAQYVGQKV